jgi:hypothetical protein
MAICRKCIVPDTFPGITFEDGVCSFCRLQEKSPHINRNYRGEDMFLEKIHSKPAGKYDCLLPLSGGKDSSYTLYHLVKKLGLKPLAAHFNSGFISELTSRNVENLCKSLDVDLVIGQATPFRRKMLRESFLAAQQGNYFKGISGIGGVCTNCENNTRSFSLREARKHNIPFIIWSSTDYEDSPEFFLSPGQKVWKDSYGELSSTISLKRIGKIYDSLVGDYRVLKYFWHLPFMMNCLRHAWYRIQDNKGMEVTGALAGIDPFIEVSFKAHGLEVLYFYEYIPYTPFENMETLKKETGWQATSGKEVRQDCRLNYLVNWRILKANGITGDGFFYSVLTREGILSREEALQKEEQFSSSLKEKAQEVIDSLDVKLDVSTLT